MFLDTEMYGRHCGETVQEYLVPCCLWHVRSAPRTIACFNQTPPAFAWKIWRLTHTDARTQDKAVAYHPASTNRGFQQVQGKVHQHKHPADEMLLRWLMPVLPLPVLPPQRVLHETAWEKSSDHTPDAWNQQHLQVSKRSGDRVHTQAGESPIRIRLNWKQLFCS